MAFIVMNPAKGVAVMVPIAAIPCIRERDILVMVVADPILAAVGFPELPGFAAKTTGLLFGLGFGCSSHLFLSLAQVRFGRIVADLSFGLQYCAGNDSGMARYIRFTPSTRNST